MEEAEISSELSCLRRFQFITQNLCFDHIISREARKAAGDKLALLAKFSKYFEKIVVKIMKYQNM